MSTETSSPALGWVVLYVTDVAKSLTFYTDALGLHVRFKADGGDYAELETGATALALCNRQFAEKSIGTALASSGALASNVTLVVADVDASWKHAIAHGGVEVLAPVTKPWGQRCSYLRDPDGHLIEIATAVG